MNPNAAVAVRPAPAPHRNSLIGAISEFAEADAMLHKQALMSALVNFRSRQRRFEYSVDTLSTDDRAELKHIRECVAHLEEFLRHVEAAT